MSPSIALRSPKLPLILITSWCSVFAVSALAGRPFDESKNTARPTPRVSADPLPLPADGALLAAADTTGDAALIAANQPLPPVVPAAGAPASAGTAAPVSASTLSKPSPSLNMTVNLIHRLVEKGVLSKEDAADLMQGAEADAAEARAQAAAQQDAAIQAAVAQAVATVQANLAVNAANADPLPSDEDSVRVTYIPESVKAQLREQIKQDVMNKARDENWAAPRQFPEWTSRIKLFGDIRVRYEGDFFPAGNDNTGAFPNFNAINTGAPFDVSGTVFSPQLNVDQDRNRVRLRARFGIDADLGDGFTAGIRIATGENNSPVSTNQSMGLANQGQGGNFSKYAIWLDRGFIKYQATGRSDKDFILTLGRFDNPFFATDLIWDDDLGFDGLAMQAKYQVARGFTPFLTAGAFPVFNTDFNFSSNQPAKFKSSDKWLYGGQLGADWKINKDFNLKLAAAYYHFDNVEGQLSDPFIPLNSSDAGNTDNTRPSFAQKGNTYMALRRIIPSPLNNFGTTNQFQYFGLATPFHELAFTGRFDINRWEPFQISLTGEWVKNLAFDQRDIDVVAVNNRGPNNSIGGIGAFDGGDTAWIVGLKVGSAALQKRWDWQVGINYRYIESDAVVDGFNDSDFGLGGTNMKGYSIFGALAVSPRTSLGLRWMSAEEIAGSPFKSDIIQVDFNGRF